jgi:glycerol-3-phosphate acyltransferase PlsY
LIAGGLVLTWVVAAALSRYSSLAALVAAASLPLWTLAVRPEPALFVAGLVMALLLVWRHEDNIRRLARGEEGRISRRAG